MYRFFLFLNIVFIVNYNLFSQTCNIPFPPGLTCEDAPIFCNLNELNGYCTTMLDFYNPTGPDPLCNQVDFSDNTIWIGFIAGTINLSLQIIPSNCGSSPKVQAGIYESPCYPNGSDIVCQGVCISGPLTLTTNNLIPGLLYYIWIDGCAGTFNNPCDITINLLQGGPLVMGSIGNISGPVKVCTGSTINYSVPPVLGAISYYWNLNDNLLQDPTISNNIIQVNFTNPGVYELCVDVSNFCVGLDDPPEQKCIDITVEDIIPQNPSPVLVCPGELYLYNSEFYGVGNFDITLTSWLGCDSIVNLKIIENPIKSTNLGIIYKCFPNCITIQDNFGNGGSFCDNAEDEQVHLKSFKGCDSIVSYTLRSINLNVKISKPYEIGCIINQSPLDGTNTLLGLDNYDHLNIKWTALNGGVLLGPDDELMSFTETAGKYCLTVEAVSPGGTAVCKDSACVIVHADQSSPTVGIIGDTLYCSRDTIFLIGLTADTNASYSWTGPGGKIYSGKKIKVSEPGVYNLTVTASNLCQVKTSYNVIQLQDGPSRPKASAKVNNLLSCDSLEIAIYGTSTLNLPTISYSWSYQNKVISTVKDTFIDKPGDYLFIVTNNKNGCADSVVVNVSQDTIKPDISTTSDTTDCLTGTATLKGSSTTPNVQFAWWTIPKGVNPLYTGTDAIVPAGNYTFEVKNAHNGCKSEQIVEAIADENTPDIKLDKDNDLNCKVLIASITASSTVGGLSYNWSGGNSTGDPKVITTSMPGIYTITVTNPINQCKSTAMITVSQDTASPQITAVTDTIKCNNPTAHIDGTSDVINNAAIIWKDTSGNLVSNLLDFTTSTSGNYLLTVSDNNNGCSSTLSITVPENIKIPNITATGAQIDCANQKVMAIGNSTTPNVNFKWTGPGGYSAATKDATGITTKGTYTFTVTDKVNGCSSTEDVMVDEDIQIPDLSLTGGTLTCINNKSVTLTATSKTGGVKYSWTGPNGYNSNQQNPTATNAGIYTATVINPVNHCSFDTTVVVNADTLAPDLSVNDAVLGCGSSSQLLNAVSMTAGVSYLWNGPGIVNVSSPSITVDKAGNYTVELTSPNGCKTIKTSTVSANGINPTAIVTVAGELNCTVKSVTINTIGSSTGQNYIYSWSGPGVIPPAATQFEASMPGIYSLTITDSNNGCSKDTSVVVPYNINMPSAITTEKANQKCYDTKDGVIKVTKITGGTPPYLYSINGKTYTSQDQFSFLSDGIYKISVQDAEGCEHDTLIQLIKPKKLSVNAGKDSLINWGTSITLNPVITNGSQIQSISWQPALDSSCNNCLNPTMTLYNSQKFTVTVEDVNTCKASDKVFIQVKKDQPVFIPNSFSPNGDGINDVFFINTGDGVEEISYFQIYDRWGEKLFDKKSFQPNDPAYGWNGKFKAKIVNSGVYVYWALIKFKDGESVLYKGDINLLR